MINKCEPSKRSVQEVLWKTSKFLYVFHEWYEWCQTDVQNPPTLFGE